MSEHTYHGESSSGQSMHRLPDVSHRTNHKGTYVAAHTFRFISPLKTDRREFPTLARHATPENRMPGRSTPSGDGRVFRLCELRIEPHGRSNRDRSGMSKPRQAISADLRLPLVRQLDGGDARRTLARDRSVAIKFISCRVSSPKPPQPSRIKKDAFEDSQFDPVEQRHSARGWTRRTLFLSGLS